MSVETPPWALQSGSFSAEITRRAVFSAYARTGANTPGIIAGGLVAAGDLAVSAPVSGMSCNVSVGECVIGGTEGANQGGYMARVSSTTNLVISAANPSNPRIDLVCATVSDSAYTEPTGGSGNQWALQVITGTPTSGATLTNLNGVGTLPASSLLLAYVLVPTSASNIITADISNVATPALLQFGQSRPWVPLTLATNITAATGFYTPSARLQGDTVRLKGALTNGTGGIDTGTLATVPSGMRPTDSSGAYLSGIETAIPSNVVVIISTAGLLTFAGSGMPSGDTLVLDGLTYTLS